MRLAPYQTRVRIALRSTPVLAWTAHVVLVLATAATTVALTPGRDSQRPHFDGPAHYLVSPLATWDGGWYVRIAREGYGGQEASAAFWPLYPLLMSVGSALTGLPHAATGVILSNASFLALLIVLYRLVLSDYGQVIATRTVWLIALWPLAFFFSAVYTESLFLLLTVSALALGRCSRWGWAALAAGLASLTRNPGILIFIPLAVMALQQVSWRPRTLWPTGVRLGAAAVMPLTYSAHLERISDDPLLMVHAGEHWGRSFRGPWDTLAAAYDRAWDVYRTGGRSCSVSLASEAFDRCRAGLQITIDAFSDDLSILAVTGLLILLPFAFRILIPRDTIYLIAGVLFPLALPATGDPLQSIARYLIVLFPIYIALAHLLRWRPLFIATIIGSAIALVGFLALFAQLYFVA